MLRKGFAVRIAAVLMALAAMPVRAQAASADTVPIAPFEVETITVPAGLAGASCIGAVATNCQIENGSVGSGCTELEIENPNIAIPPTLGEGFDTTPCQAFISATLSISACTVTGNGWLSFEEDSPVGGAAGGTFAFQVTGTTADMVLQGESAAGPNGFDEVAGTAVLGPCGGLLGTFTYTARTLYVALPPPLAG